MILLHSVPYEVCQTTPQINSWMWFSWTLRHHGVFWQWMHYLRTIFILG